MNKIYDKLSINNNITILYYRGYHALRYFIYKKSYIYYFKYYFNITLIKQKIYKYYKPLYDINYNSHLIKGPFINNNRIKTLI